MPCSDGSSKVVDSCSRLVLYEHGVMGEEERCFPCLFGLLFFLGRKKVKRRIKNTPQ